MCRISAMNKLAADELKNNKLLKVFLAVASVCVIGFPLMAACAFEDDVSHDYGVFLGATSADIDVMKEYETVVIDAQYYTADEIDELQADGHQVYSYINLGSLEDYRPYYDEYSKYSLDVYEHWEDERWMDVSQKEWQDFLVKELAPSILDKGVDGLFVDNVDVYYNYETEAIYEGVTTILKGFVDTGAYVVINGGDTYVWEYAERNDSLDGVLDAVNQESVFSAIDWDNEDSFMTADEEDHEYFTEYVEMVAGYDKDVYLLEYSTDEDLIAQIDTYCRNNGFTYYVSSTLALRAR